MIKKIINLIDIKIKSDKSRMILTIQSILGKKVDIDCHITFNIIKTHALAGVVIKQDDIYIIQEQVKKLKSLGHSDTEIINLYLELLRIK